MEEKDTIKDEIWRKRRKKRWRKLKKEEMIE